MQLQPAQASKGFQERGRAVGCLVAPQDKGRHMAEVAAQGRQVTRDGLGKAQYVTRAAIGGIHVALGLMLPTALDLQRQQAAIVAHGLAIDGVQRQSGVGADSRCFVDPAIQVCIQLLGFGSQARKHHARTVGVALQARNLRA
ncbi:hypothetical protein D3C73_685150 [compost metagenome]